MNNNMAKAARRLVSQQKMAIVPIEPMRKYPLAKNWGNKVITDPDIAESFFLANPDWNMGAALYPSNLCSLDVDHEEWFRIICDAMGIDIDQVVNDYPTIRGNDGFRIIFSVPDGASLPYHKISWRPESDPSGDKHRSIMAQAREAKKSGNSELEKKLRSDARKFSPKSVFELRAATDGFQRQDVMPPSIHPETKKPYVWLTEPSGKIPELPPWLLTIWREYDDKFKSQFMSACPWIDIDDVYKPKRSNEKSSRYYSSDGGLVAVARDYERHMRIEDALENYGYKRMGRKRYLSPMSSTGLAGVVVMSDNKCWIHHASDPLCSDSTGQPVSSFDLFCEYEHGGDFAKAARELAVASGVRIDTPTRNSVPAVVGDIPESVIHSDSSASVSVDIYTPLPWTNTREKPVNHYENLQEVARRAGIKIRYNMIAKEEEIIIPYKSFSRDNIANASIAELISLCSLFDLSTSHIQEHITLIADQNQYSPAVSWIDSKKWDGVKRVNDFLNTVRAKGGDGAQKLKNTLISRWMLSAIHAAFSPTGISASGMLVFAGSQGLGKTSWFERLVPRDVNDTMRLVQDGLMLNTEDKDSQSAVLRHWLVELGEIDSTFKRSDLSQLKAFITRDTDIIRRPYARKESVYARRTVLFGSVNTTEYLQDDTGNRRFWTVDCESIDYAHDLDMQQVWAEYLHYYRSGEKWFLNPSELMQLNEHNRDYEAGDPVRDRILGALNWSADRSTWEYHRATDILVSIGMDRPTRADLTRAGNIIRDLNGNSSSRCRNRGRLLLVPPVLTSSKNDIRGW